MEQYAKNKRTAEEGKLVGTLMWDKSQQQRIPAALASVYAENCYARVNHTVTSLTLQAFGIPKSGVLNMLSTIGTMQFSICTGFGESEVLHGGSMNNWYHWLCQRNGAAPAGWTTISIVIINRQPRTGHTILIQTPILVEKLLYCAGLFLENKDIGEIGKHPNDTIIEVGKRFKKAITCWSDRLQATGGSLKHRKYYYYTIGYK